MSKPEDIVRRLNSEDCELAIGLCLREYKERDCWLCILKEYSNEVYNQALDDLLKQMKERADDCSDIPNMFDKGYYQAYEHMCYEAEQLKK